MIFTFEQLIDNIDEKLLAYGITAGEVTLDHVGHKCLSLVDYLEHKKTALKSSTLVYEGIVRECDLGIYRFHLPVRYKQHMLLGFELLLPKAGESIPSFWDHVEFVIKKGSLQEFVDAHPNVKWDTSAIDKDVFPKIAIRFEGGLSAKFHVADVFEEVSKM